MNKAIPVTILICTLLSGCNLSIDDDSITVTGLPPVIDSLQISAMTQTTATITFNTNESATVTINYADNDYYATNAAYNLTEQVVDYNTVHSVTLSNLNPSTTYHYQVVAQDADANTTTIRGQSFTTPAPDNIALTITNPTPSQSSVLQAGTASTQLGVTTNKPASCRYSTVANTAYADMVDSFATTGSTLHASTLSGLVDGTAYTYYIRCLDLSGNATTNDFSIDFSVDAAVITNTPPVLDPIQNVVVTAGGTVSFNPTATDLEKHPLTYSYSGWMTSSSYTTQATDIGIHTVTVTVDDGNGGTDSQDVTVEVVDASADIVPPLRSSSVNAWEILAAGTLETTISVSTDEESTCKYSATANENYSLMTNTFSAANNGKTHSALLDSLTDATAYTYYVRCEDVAGNVNIDDFPITFSVSFDGYSDPEPGSFKQAVDDGLVAPVTIDGSPWTFRTPPPPENERTVRTDHPRLLLTADNLPGIQTKLADPVYASLMTRITSRADSITLSDHYKMLENAFLYQIKGDRTRGEAAKQALLNYDSSIGYGNPRGPSIMSGYDSMSSKLAPVLAFDWIWDLLDTNDKATIFAHLKDNFRYDHHTADPIILGNDNGPGTYPWYWNDVYKGFPELFLPALAFAIYDEGIDDAWAEEVIRWAYNEDEPRVMGPYGPNRGSGFLDVLATLSLDTGGTSQVGEMYFDYWVEVVHAVSFWETATGQPMWSRAPILTKNPRAILTGRDGVAPASRTTSALEYVTGVTGGETAALAKWVVEFYGPARYQTVYRAILGDMRVTAKSPADLNLPTADYLRGDHTFYSKESWADDAVSLYVRSPYINVGRYVGNEGVFALYKGRTAISPRARVGKMQPHAGMQSGIWIYDPYLTKPDGKGNDVHVTIDSIQNEGTFWGNHQRSFDAWTTVSKDRYFDGGPEAVDVTPDYRAIRMEYGDRYAQISVGKAYRTMVHIPDGERNFIVVYDYVDGIQNLKTAWSMRLLEEPVISGSTFSIPNTFNATVVAPAGHTMEWLGGYKLEFVSPSPEREWYTENKNSAIPGCSVVLDDAKNPVLDDNGNLIPNPTLIEQFGLGNLYIQPPGQKDSSVAPYAANTEYLVVIEVGAAAPLPVTSTADREVSFGQWKVSFSTNGAYQVTKNPLP